MMKAKTFLGVATTSVLCISIVGCASVPDAGGDARITGTLGGALLGCIAGELSGHGCARGAAVGAVVGLAAGWVHESRKTASAQEVNNRYAQQGIKIPRNEVRIQDVRLTALPGELVKQGEEIEIVSDIDLIGSGAVAPQIIHEATLLGQNGQKLGFQTVTVDKVDGAGAYRSSLGYTIPKGKPGTYTVVNSVRVGNTEQSKNFRFHVVVDEHGRATMFAQRSSDAVEL